MNILKIWASALIMMAAASLQCFAQTTRVDNHIPRYGDKLSMDQIACVSVGGNGRNRSWDFSNLDVIKPKHKVQYLEQQENLMELVEAENRTLTFYNLCGDTLTVTGYENNTTKTVYNMPAHAMHFPLTVGDSIEGYFHGICNFSGKMHIRVLGKSYCMVDASGNMRLPSGETLNGVIRTHTKKVVSQIPLPDDYVTYDSIKQSQLIRSFDTDSIEWYIVSDTAKTTIDTYCWYAAGYRYPIVRTIRVADNNDEEMSLIAYYFSPEKQQELVDPDNESLRNQEDVEIMDGDDMLETNTEPIIDYEVSVSERQITLSYSLKETATVKAILCDIRGMVYNSCSSRNPAGTNYALTLDCNGLRPGEYVLYINVNGVIFSNKVKIG